MCDLHITSNKCSHPFDSNRPVEPAERQELRYIDPEEEQHTVYPDHLYLAIVAFQSDPVPHPLSKSLQF